MTISIFPTANDYDTAALTADRHAFHTFFDTHVLLNSDGSFSLVEETDYETLPAAMIDQICYTAPGQMAYVD